MIEPPRERKMEPTLEVVRAPAEMRARSIALHREGRRIALVPTMGYLHEGHLSLLDEARRRADVVALSIFVNPTQFGPTEDLARYPRDLDGDLEKARTRGCDLAFVPEAAAIYPPGFQTYVEVRELQRGLCGEHRPGHFVGVATVVLKLFNIVKPDVALFGEKDFQQLQVIRRMVRDLDLDVEIVGCPIVREPDGLAKSSRNSYLSPDERSRALGLFTALAIARAAFEKGERSTEALVSLARAPLDAAARQGRLTLEYLELRDAETLAPASGTLVRPAVLAVCARVGATRLIDNVVLAP
jgi:pantoate--beta-alanine ligase